MFTKRILGLVIGVSVMTSPWVSVQAQDDIALEDWPVEVVSDAGEPDLISEPIQSGEEVTVKTHLVHIFTKLDVDSRSRAVHVAQDMGLIE